MCASGRLAGESKALVLGGGLFVAGAIRVGAVAEAATALAESATAGEVGGGGLPGGMLLSPALTDDRGCAASCGGAPG